MLPRLAGCLFKFIQKQPPDTRASSLARYLMSDWCKKTEKVFLEISPKIHKENTCARVSFSNFIKKETLAPVSCEFCKISKNTFFIEHLFSCSLGDCCFFLLIFLSPSFHLFVVSYRYLILSESVLQLN